MTDYPLHTTHGRVIFGAVVLVNETTGQVTTVIDGTIVPDDQESEGAGGRPAGYRSQ